MYRDSATWRLDYKLPGVHPLTGKRWPGRKLTLGKLSPAFHLAEARIAALEMKAKVKKGIDPATERQAELTANLAETAGAEFTVSDLIARFRAVKEPGWRAETRKHYGSDLKAIEAGLGTLPVVKVTRRHLARFLLDFNDRQVASGHKGTRGERLAVLIGSLFRFAVEHEFIELSPAQRLPKPAVAGNRSRALAAEEITAVWRALTWAPGSKDGTGPAPLLVLKLSLATGQRIGTVATTRVEELDLGGQALADEVDTGPLWRIPAEDGRKTKHERLVPLSAYAVMLWREALALPGRDGPFVFPGHSLARPLAVNTVSKAWERLRELGRVPADTVAHDLRRTARSWWSRLPHGQDRDAMERLLGHVVGDHIERVYDRALHLPAQRAVADAWGAKLAKITGAAAVTEAANPEPSSAQSRLASMLVEQVNGSYRQAAEQKLYILLEAYRRAQAAGDVKSMDEAVVELGTLMLDRSGLVDEYAAELGRVERLRNVGPIQQQRASTVLHQCLAAAAVARWDAEPSLSKKELAAKLSRERPDLGSWRTIYDHLPTRKGREVWARRARRSLELQARLGREDTWGDPACQQAIQNLQQV